MRYTLAAVLLALQATQAPPPPRSAWLDLQNTAVAEKLLQPDTVVVIPIGAGVLDHGRHLPLGTDFYLADRLAHDIMPLTSVVVVPPVTTMVTRDEIVDIVRRLSQRNPRRFYAINTSQATGRELRNAAALLANDGILLRYADITPVIGEHGREAETSAILQIEPKWAVMENAEGDAARATAARGKSLLEVLTATVVNDIEALRKASPPSPRPIVPTPRRTPLPRIVPGRGMSNCQEADERAITQLGDAFNLKWTEKNAQELAGLWSKEGDLVHPDGTSEHGRETIQQNRAEQFMRREYSSSKHVLAFGVMRCVSDDVAVVDGKWELMQVYDQAGNLLPRGDGLLTVVLKKQGGWLIEAYRYTVNQQALRPPTLLKKPGYPDK
jgi:creatinine amidohydrolase